jgi:hypothetical protein
VHLLSFADRDHALCNPSIRKIDSQWDHGQPSFFSSTSELMQLASMEQQLAIAFGRVIPNTCLSVFVDLATHQPHLARLKTRVSLFNGASTVAKTFDFAAMQHDPALDRIQDLVLKPSFPILSDHFVSRRGNRLGFGRLAFFVFGLRIRSRWLSFLFIQALRLYRERNLPAGKLVGPFVGKLIDCIRIVEVIGGRVEHWKQGRRLTQDAAIQ